MPSMACRACSRSRLLLSALLTMLSAPGGPRSRSWAQETCGTTTTDASPLRVESSDDALALGAAVDCADGGAVEAVWAGAVTLDAPISVGSGTFLSVTGEDGLAEVQGGSQIRLFQVSPSGGLTLANLTLSGGSGESGGAIYASSAAVTLEGCVLEGNDATAGDGGAVWAEGGELTIVGGEFSGNSASGNGGAVLAVDGAVVIREGARFEENRAAREGGALYCGGAENSTVVGAAASCSLGEAVFSANQAGSIQAVDALIEVTSWTELYGGGGAAFYRVAANITDSVFESNYAQLAGGGIFGGTDSDMTVDGCTLEENSTPGYGGALAASSATLRGGTLLTNNSAADGGGVLGWDVQRLITFDDMECHANAASSEGGCFFAAGGGLTTNSTKMRDNEALTGGCINADGFAEININGGEFTGCTSTGNGGFLYVSDGSTATISGGTVSNCVAGRRAGVMYCSGDFRGFGSAQCTITGGTFTNNQALELGGAISAWGTTTGAPTPTVITITGGLFSNNTSKFYGGFIFLEESASLVCSGAVIQDSTAGDQGGAIYAREAVWVNSSCDLIGNAAPQGAAAYLTFVGGANFEDHNITDKLGTGVSVLYAAQTPVVARGVNFQSEADHLHEDSTNRAVRLEGEASLAAEGCVFAGWVGDTVIISASPNAGSLVLDSCDFSESSATMMVLSPNSDAEVRNCFVGDATIENAAVVNGSLFLVDRALGCEDPDACGPGECVDSDLGVLCECLEDAGAGAAGGGCLDGGGALSVALKTAPPAVTYSPDPVYFELNVSAAAEGTTPTIWNLTAEADDLGLLVVPSSGVLRPGTGVTVAVLGTPLRYDVGGELVSRFVANSVGNGTSDSAAGSPEIEVESAFYLCQAFEYALPVEDTDTDSDTGADTDTESGFECEPCATIGGVGAEGVNCELPGATLASLPVNHGYWRSGQDSRVVHQCIHPDACTGATEVATSDDYCDDGYKGPYCAVCKEGYGEGAGRTCHACDSTKSRLLIAAGALFMLFELTLLVVGVVFLVGGLDAVQNVRRSLTSRLVGRRSPAASIGSAGYREGDARRDRLGPASAFAPMNTVSAEGEAGEAQRLERGSGSDSGRGSGGGNGEPVVWEDGSSRRPGEADGRSSSSASDGGGRGKSAACCGLGERIKRWASRLPLDKLKILVVVWQILTVFPSITGADFPAPYARFLSWIDVVNFDLASLFAGSCILPTLDFYQRLVLTTLAPLVLAGILAVTYRMAKRRAGTGAAGVELRKAAWSRHVAAGLLISFLVFTSTSTIAFKTFACDEEAVEGESFLRADYNLSCNSTKHTWYGLYAGIMIVVYPIGIPLLYAFILWKKREFLNPRFVAENDGHAGGLRGEDRELSLEQRLEMRMKNPELAPSIFLWKDFGPDMYYYEVIECGRRILLTGVLIFISPNTSAQAAAACMFAFLSLLGFELLRPHLDPADSWLYRLGCVIIFLTNFLALLIKVDSAGEASRDIFGGIMVAINVLLILAVLLASWFSTQQSVDDHRDGETFYGVAGKMMTFEQLAAKSARLSLSTVQQPSTASPVLSCLRSASSFSSSGGGQNNITSPAKPREDHDGRDEDHGRSLGGGDDDQSQELKLDRDGHADAGMGMGDAERAWSSSSLSTALQEALAATAAAAAAGEGRGYAFRRS